MANLQKQPLVSSAEFQYSGQEDLVRLIRLVDPSDIEFSLTFMANTSDRFRELYSKIEGSRGRIVGVDSDYEGRVLNIPDSQKNLPIDDPIKILPIGLQRFVADLDELIDLSEKEKVVPLLRVMRKEDHSPEIGMVYISAPKIDNSAGGLDPSTAGHIQQQIDRAVYRPRLKKLSSIGALAKGCRPNILTYANIRHDEATVREGLSVLDTVPSENVIASINIGMKPRDEGGREFYRWECSSRILSSMYGIDGNPITLKFGKLTDASKVESDLRNHGVNLTLLPD